MFACTLSAMSAVAGMPPGFSSRRPADRAISSAAGVTPGTDATIWAACSAEYMVSTFWSVPSTSSFEICARMKSTLT
ncbi:hypothetical protein D3C86_1635320 [compost metagenome]